MTCETVDPQFFGEWDETYFEADLDPVFWPCNECGLPCLEGDELCGTCYENARRDEELEAMHPEWRCPPRE